MTMVKENSLQLPFSSIYQRLKSDLVVALLGSACLILTAFLIIVGTSLAPAHLKGSANTMTVTIPEGYNTRQIANLLDSQGLIRNPTMFRVWARLRGNSESLQAGQYVLSPSSNAFAILDKLSMGDVVLDTAWVTIPEGYNIKQVAEVLADKGLVSQEEFLQELEDINLPFSWAEDIPDGLLQKYEGYLFPDTYEFATSASAYDIIMRMATRFDNIIAAEYENSKFSDQFTFHEMATLASVVEKEAAVDDERPIISSVFHNRLSDGHALQSCATVQYLLPEPKPVLSTADTKIDSPYNTYQNPGLPPGPIASFSKASFLAALNPADTDYYYFNARNDGRHEFSRTFAEHLRAISKHN